jgi:hypothetical protein
MLNNPEFEAEISNLRHENIRMKRLISDYEAEKLHSTVTKGIALPKGNGFVMNISTIVCI